MNLNEPLLNHADDNEAQNVNQNVGLRRSLSAINHNDFQEASLRTQNRDLLGEICFYTLKYGVAAAWLAASTHYTKINLSPECAAIHGVYHLVVGQFLG